MSIVSDETMLSLSFALAYPFDFDQCYVNRTLEMQGPFDFSANLELDITIICSNG